MKRSAQSSRPALWLICIAGLVSRRALAEEASATETAAARAVAVEGLKLAQAGNCAGAVPKLERAEKLYHSPVVASRLGECYVSLGRLVEGTEVLRKVLREPVSGDKTPALTKALERAQQALDAAAPHIAALTIKVPAVSDMNVHIDGQSVPSALIDTEVPIDPGDHVVEVAAPGFTSATSRVHVGDGEKKSVTLTLARDPNAAVAPAPSTTTEPNRESASVTSEAAPKPAPEPRAVPPEPRAAAHKSSHTAAYVSWGIGVAGVAAGSVLGLNAMKRYEHLHDQCPGDVCSGAQSGDLDAAKRVGTLSTVAFGVGGAAILLGTVLFVTAGSGDDEQAHASMPRRSAGPSLAGIAVGPGRIVLDGRF